MEKYYKRRFRHENFSNSIIPMCLATVVLFPIPGGGFWLVAAIWIGYGIWFVWKCKKDRQDVERDAEARKRAEEIRIELAVDNRKKQEEHQEVLKFLCGASEIPGFLENYADRPKDFWRGIDGFYMLDRTNLLTRGAEIYKKDWDALSYAQQSAILQDRYMAEKIKKYILKTY